MAEDKKAMPPNQTRGHQKPAESRTRSAGKDENEALELVRLRNYFYRDSYRRTLFLLLLCISIILVLSVTIFYLYATKPKPVYFATTPDGQLIKLSPLNEPNITEDNLRSWVSTALLKIYNFNFANYEQQLSWSRRFFTDQGYTDFVETIRSSLVLKTVIDKKLVVTATITDTPILENQGSVRIGGNLVYAWRWRVPMLLHYESLSMQLKQPVEAVVTVQRVSTLQDPQGIAISSLVQFASGQS